MDASSAWHREIAAATFRCAEEFYGRAERAVAGIDDPDDRAVVEGQLTTVPTVRG